MRSSIMNQSKFAIVVLAAGNSSRLGEPKQLVQYQGQTLLERQVELALAHTDSVYLVLGSRRDLMTDKVSEYPIHVVENNEWHQGMGKSIAYGVDALDENIEQVMLLTVDQWRLTSKDIAKLIQCANENYNNIIVSYWLDSAANSQYGPPVIFPKAFFTKLIRLEGMQGAKTIVKENKALVQQVKITNAGYDVDTREDLQQLKET